MYNWKEIGIKEITNLYLYGKKDTPQDMMAQEIVRIKLEENECGAKITVGMNSFMEDGPGRFALAADAPLVQAFFDAANSSKLDNGKTYVIDDLVDLLGLGAQSERFDLKPSHYTQVRLAL